MDIILTRSNSRISRMSRRRQKIALKSRPRTKFTNAYPIAAGSNEIASTESGMISMTVSFQQ